MNVHAAGGSPGVPGPPSAPLLPGGPAGPAGPGTPGGPAGPVGPWGPVTGSPGSPVGPGGPVSPGCPSLPGSPSGPGGPVNPGVPSRPSTPGGPTGPAGPASPAGPRGPGTGSTFARAAFAQIRPVSRPVLHSAWIWSARDTTCCVAESRCASTSVFSVVATTAPHAMTTASRPAAPPAAMFLRFLIRSRAARSASPPVGLIAASFEVGVGGGVLPVFQNLRRWEPCGRGGMRGSCHLLQDG